MEHFHLKKITGFSPKIRIFSFCSYSLFEICICRGPYIADWLVYINISLFEMRTWCIKIVNVLVLHLFYNLLCSCKLSNLGKPLELGVSIAAPNNHHPTFTPFQLDMVIRVYKCLPVSISRLGTCSVLALYACIRHH
jgi:hypothetical protein